MGRFDRRLVRYGSLLLIWTAVGLFFFSQDVSRAAYWDDPTPRWRYLVTWLTACWLLAVLTLGILWLGRRWPLERPAWPRRLAIHGALSLGFAALDLVLVATLASALGFLGPLAPVRFGEAAAVLAITSFHNNLLTYWIVLGLQQGFGYYRRYQDREKQAIRLELHTAELETQLVRTRLAALKMQLQPHFLFNTMNAIMVLIRQQRGAEAEETIGRLSDLLRFVLDDAQAQEVALRRELEYLRLYLSIEQLRFADRLRVELDTDPAVLDALVPHMALSPIVENAIRHGTAQREDGGTIRLTARREGDALVVEVSDDGPGLAAAPPSPGHGIGLDNTRARLHQLYGDRASLSIRNGAAAGAVVRLVVPYRVAAVEDAA